MVRDRKKNDSRRKPQKKAEGQITEKEMETILQRARQAVKPTLNREAANELVSDDLLNFRMKLNR